MIPAKVTLFVAAAASVNGLPIFSGFFKPRAASPAPAKLHRRDLNSTQFAQGTNFFFSSLLLEAECTPGQVSCINGNTATCSGEANWEITPCAEGTSCYAIPATDVPTDDSLVVKCLTQDQVQAALGTQTSEDFQIQAAPFNSTITTDPTTTDTGSDSPTDSGVPSTTDSSSDEPTTTDSTAEPTCTPGDDDGDDDGSDDPSSDDTSPTDTTSDDSSPTDTCTEDPEPTETEYITVIAFPDPTDSSQFTYSTVLPTPTDSVSDTDPTPTDSSSDSFSDPDPTYTCTDSTEDPTDDPTDSSADPTPTDSSSDPAPTDTNIDTVTGSDVDAPTDTYSFDDPAPTDSVAPSDDSTTDSSTDSSTDSRTTLSVPPALATPTTPVNVGNVPDISVVDTHFIPATSIPPIIKKVRRW